MAEKTALAAAPPIAKATVKPGTLQRKCACGGTTGASGMCPECERKARGLLQRAAAGADSAPSVVSNALSGPGHGLDAGTRATMERGFGTDLSHVRLHTDAQAGESARAVDAHAYTVGSDIAFAPGKYDPHSEGGRRLLAHEIAHTVQQGGLQRSAAATLDVSPAYSAAEAEADRAADAVLSGRSAPALGATGLAVARAKDPAAPPDAEPKKTVPAVETPPTSSPANPAATTGAVASPYDKLQDNIPGLRSILPPPDGASEPVFVFETLPVPSSKGPYAEAAYDAAAKSGVLNAFVDVSGAKPRMAHDSEEARIPSTMGALWLQRVGWDATSAPLLWQKLSGNAKVATSFSPPKIDGQPRECQFDHVIELQVGGNNASDNVQILDQRPNASSGGTIQGECYRQAKAVKDGYRKAKLPEPKTVAMRFATVTVEPAKKTFSMKCADLDQKARVATKEALDKGGKPTSPANTKLLYGSIGTDLYVDPAGDTVLGGGRASSADIGAYRLVTGFLLSVYHTAKGKPDAIDAAIDADTLVRKGGAKSPIAIIVESQPKVRFKAEDAGASTAGDPGGAKDAGGGVQAGLAQKRVKFDRMDNSPLKFYYPALSHGELKLAYDEGKGEITGKDGKFKSDKPILKDLDLGLDLTPDVLAVVLKTKPRSVPFIPNATIIESGLRINILPTFGGSGKLAVKFGEYATAAVTITVDAQGIRADGDLLAKVPGLDSTAGTIQYRDGKWSGAFDVAFSNPKIPGFVSAKLHVGFADGKVSPEGTINLKILDTDVQLKATLAGGAWVFAVQVPHLKIPGLDGPVSVWVSYSNGNLTAVGENASLTFGKWKGALKKLKYENGRLSGTGAVTVGKPEDRVSGTIDAQLFPNGTWTADGTVSVRIKEGLVATVGLHIDENHKVSVKGELKFPDYQIPNTTFGRQIRRELGSLSFPIAGLSLGSRTIGFSFDITAFIEGHYAVGPATLKDMYVKASFDPFEEQKDYDLEGHAKLAVPMDVGFGGGIEGALALSAAYLASARFGVRATLGIGAKAESGVEGKVGYKSGKFYVDSMAYIKASPYLTLGLDAFVRAEVIGFDPYEHKWPIRDWTLPGGFDVGVFAPFKYDVEKGFQVPSLEDVKVTYPDVNVRDLMNKLMNKVGI